MKPKSRRVELKAGTQKHTSEKQNKWFGLLTPAEIAYLTKFLVIFGGLFLLIEILPLTPLLIAIASFETLLMNALGVQAYSVGQLVYTANAVFLIAPECSGLVMGAMLTALVFSTKVSNKGRALALFIPVLFLFNLIRLAATIDAGAIWGVQTMETVHAALWVVDTALVFLIWTKLVSLNGNPIEG